MKSATSTPTALLIIDVQQGLAHPTYFGTSPRSTPEAEDNIARLLATARSFNGKAGAMPVQILHIHHHTTGNPKSPLRPGNSITVEVTESNGDGKITKMKTVPGTDPKPCAVPFPGEPVMTKNVNSAFIGTDLEARIRRDGIRQLIVVGLVTDHCVSTSVRMAANLGVVNGEDGSQGTIVLVSDGCGAFGKEKYGISGDEVHRVNLASLDGEFAEIESTEDVLLSVFNMVQ